MLCPRWHHRPVSARWFWLVACAWLTRSISLQEFGWLLEGFDLWKNKPHRTLSFEAVS
jgi:hypothetical protein